MINSQYTGVDANLVERQLVNSGSPSSDAGASNGLAAAISWQTSVALLLDSRFGLASDRAKMRLPLPETVIVGQAIAEEASSAGGRVIDPRRDMSPVSISSVRSTIANPLEQLELQTTRSARLLRTFFTVTERRLRDSSMQLADTAKLVSSRPLSLCRLARDRVANFVWANPKFHSTDTVRSASKVFDGITEFAAGLTSRSQTHVDQSSIVGRPARDARSERVVDVLSARSPTSISVDLNANSSNSKIELVLGAWAVVTTQLPQQLSSFLSSNWSAESALTRATSESGSNSARQDNDPRTSALTSDVNARLPSQKIQKPKLQGVNFDSESACISSAAATQCAQQQAINGRSHIIETPTEFKHSAASASTRPANLSGAQHANDAGELSDRSAFAAAFGDGVQNVHQTLSSWTAAGVANCRDLGGRAWELMVSFPRQNGHFVSVHLVGAADGIVVAFDSTCAAARDLLAKSARRAVTALEAVTRKRVRLVQAIEQRDRGQGDGRKK
jgi:hypothetical protein